MVVHDLGNGGDDDQHSVHSSVVTNPVPHCRSAGSQFFRKVHALSHSHRWIPRPTRDPHSYRTPQSKLTQGPHDARSAMSQFLLTTAEVAHTSSVSWPRIMTFEPHRHADRRRQHSDASAPIYCPASAAVVLHHPYFETLLLLHALRDQGGT